MSPLPWLHLVALVALRCALAAAGRVLHLVALLPLVLLTSCTPKALPPLRPTFDEAAELGDRLRTRVQVHEDALRADLRRRLSECPAEPPDERRRCGLAAGATAVALADPERLLLWLLAQRYQEARTALQTAQVCQRSGEDTCQETERARAVELLGRLRAELDAKESP